MEVKTLKSYLANTGVSAFDFSERIGCSNGQLSLIINGKKKPSLKTARRIYKATNGIIKITPYDWKEEMDGKIPWE